jgi:hypothetical protein
MDRGRVAATSVSLHIYSFNTLLGTLELGHNSSLLWSMTKCRVADFRRLRLCAASFQNLYCQMEEGQVPWAASHRQCRPSRIIRFKAVKLMQAVPGLRVDFVTGELHENVN